MRAEPLPLLLLTGFLGSGKTSTLQHWLEKTGVSLKKTAVIINDFGTVNVDAALLSRRQLELRSITGGCVCCQSFEDLVEQTAALAENPAIELAWIETSGLADPEEVFDHLSGPELQDRTVIRRLILVIDGSDFPCSWRGRAVQEEQVRYADLILLNKTDRIDEEKGRRIEETLRKLNPRARLVRSEHGRVDPDLLSGAGQTTLKGHGHEGHAHPHHHADHPHAASTLFLPLKEPVARGDFQRFLAHLPASVFRAKGFVRFTDSARQLHTFQKVRDQAELMLLPLEDNLEIATGLVLIGPNLDETSIRELAETSLLTAV
jgi:G3E family GTPase